MIDVSALQTMPSVRDTEKVKDLQRKAEAKSFETELINALLDTESDPVTPEAEMPRTSFSAPAYAKDNRKINGKPVDTKLMDVCTQMESIFVKQMLDQMKKNIDKGEFLHGGQAEDIFEDMLYSEYSMQVAKNGNMGIARSMYDQLSRVR